jgi:hypothetical protein
MQSWDTVALSRKENGMDNQTEISKQNTCVVCKGRGYRYLDDFSGSRSKCICVADKQKEIELIAQVLTHPSGYDIDNGGVIWVRRYEYPKWCVEWERWVEDEQSFANNEIEVREFNDPLSAATFFVNKRYELGIGLDQ